jgi:hypothetical protein
MRSDAVDYGVSVSIRLNVVRYCSSVYKLGHEQTSHLWNCKSFPRAV